MALRHSAPARERGRGLEGTTAPEVRGQGKEAGPLRKAFPLYLFMSVGWGGGWGTDLRINPWQPSQGRQFGEANAMVVSISWSFLLCLRQDGPFNSVPKLRKSLKVFEDKKASLILAMANPIYCSHTRGLLTTLSGLLFSLFETDTRPASDSGIGLFGLFLVQS